MKDREAVRRLADKYETISVIEGTSTLGTIVIVGTSHKSVKSAELVNDVADACQPDIFAVELCRERFFTEGVGITISSKKNWMKFIAIALTGFVFNILTGICQLIFREDEEQEDDSDEQFIGDFEELIISAARQDKEVALIDRSIGETVTRLIQEVGLHESAKLFVPFYSGGTERQFSGLAGQGEFSATRLSECQENVEKELPAFHTAVLEERNDILAQNLHELRKDYETIVAVVGASHEPPVTQTLRQQQTMNTNRTYETVSVGEVSSIAYKLEHCLD